MSVDKSGVCYFTDNSTSYSCGYKIEGVMENIEYYCKVRDNFKH